MIELLRHIGVATTKVELARHVGVAPTKIELERRKLVYLYLLPLFN